MVLAFHGVTLDPGWLRRVLESKAIGTPGFKVLNLRRYHFDVTYAAATDDRVLVQALRQGIPPIALVFTASLSYWERATAHAVVVTGMDNAVVSVNDPAYPEISQALTHNEFMLAWSDFDYLYALVRPEES